LIDTLTDTPTWCAGSKFTDNL